DGDVLQTRLQPVERGRGAGRGGVPGGQGRLFAAVGADLDVNAPAQDRTLLGGDGHRLDHRGGGRVDDAAQAAVAGVPQVVRVHHLHLKGRAQVALGRGRGGRGRDRDGGDR